MVLSPYRFNKRAVALQKARVKQESELYSVHAMVHQMVVHACAWKRAPARDSAFGNLPILIHGQAGTYKVRYQIVHHETILEFRVTGPDGSHVGGSVKLC